MQKSRSQVFSSSMLVAALGAPVLAELASSSLTTLRAVSGKSLDFTQ